MTKYLLRIILAFTILLTIFTQCKKEDSADSLPEPKFSDTIIVGVSARVLDTNWVANQIVATKKNGQIFIEATMDSISTISIYINGDKPGIYQFNGSSQNIAFYQDLDGNTYLSHGVASIPGTKITAGVVQLSEVNDSSSSISGSFIFTLYNAKTGKYVTISEGSIRNIPFFNFGEIPSEGGLEGTLNSFENFTSSYADSKVTIFDNTQMILSFKSNNDDILEFNLQKYSPGLYSISQVSKNNINYYSNDFENTGYALSNTFSSGFINIISNNKISVSGTYSFNIFSNKIQDNIISLGCFKNIKVDSLFTSKNKLFCKLSNLNYESKNTYAYFVKDKIKIISFDQNGNQKLVLFIPNNPEVKSYSISPDNKNAFAQYFDDNGKMYTSNEGSINITSIIDSLKSDFSFKAINENGGTISISNGHFDIESWK